MCIRDRPKAVFIDTDTLLTLPKRHFYNGLVEALKAGLIYDEKLFALFEEEDIPVSYTQLDVYTRQVFHFEIKVFLYNI